MIIFNFYIGFFALFVAPQIYLSIRYTHVKYSLLLTYGLIISFTASWVLFLIAFYFELNHAYIFPFTLFIFLLTLTYLYINAKKVNHTISSTVIWVLTFALMFPLLQYATGGFTSLDAVCSWHRWALELFNNNYDPIDAAYPILLPSLWSLIYKIQGTSDIWWTAQITLAVIPLMTLAILFSLYNETKNNSFIFISIFLYPYLLSGWTINGFMDMPVMIMGTLSIILIYAAEIYKEKIEFEYYIYASLFIAGISSIIKQSGLVFILFTLIYIILNRQLFKRKKTLFIVIILSILYFLSFLILYYIYSHYGATDNIGHLKHLSTKNFSDDMTKTFFTLFNLFFTYPRDTFWFSEFYKPLSSHPITPYLLGVGLSLFFLKPIRKNSSVSLLSVIFLILSFIVWGIYFSYDARNSFWVKSFMIIFISINISYFIDNYIRIKTFIFMLFIFIFYIGIYSLQLKDEFAYKKQKNFQTHIGNDKIAKYAKVLLKDTKSCTKIYTNDQYLQFNYYTSEKVKNNLIIDRRYGLKALDSVEHTCKDGRYFIFRDITTHYPDWWKILRLTKDGIIKRISDKDLIYFIPPNIKLKNDYYSIRTNFINKTLENYKTDLKYNIDKIEEKKDHLVVKGWAFIENIPIDKTIKYIVLKNDKHTYILNTKINIRHDVTQHFKVKDLSQSGFTGYLFKKDFFKAKYDIYILAEEKNGKQHLIKTDQNIIIK